jgi:tripartite-type tricarboxylate transporter receptor subunit TctC
MTTLRQNISATVLEGSMRYGTTRAAGLVAGLIVGLACLLAAPRFGHAENYPTRRITLVAPWPPAGAIDVLCREIAPGAGERLGQPIVVENRPGAGSTIGTADVAKATPDGYTLFMGTSTQLAIQVTLHKSLPYDPATDFIPIALVASVPFVLIVHPSLPVHTAGELIDLARKRPGQLSFGSSGVGGPPHLYMELLQTMTGTKMVHIPYKGTAEAILDVVAGRVPILMSDVAPAAPLIKAGTVRALGVSSTTRVAALPDVPPIAENGVPGFDAVAWLMLVAPAAVPPTIVDTLHGDLKTIVAEPHTRQKLVALGVIPIDSPPVAALKTFVKSEIVRWDKVVEHAGLAGSQ